MRRPGRRTFTLFCALLFAAATAFAATAADFYLNLMRRGISDFNAGRFQPAVNQLQIAAFGLLEAVEQFQTAQVYIAVASDRLGREADARRAAQRVIAAERVQRHFTSLALPGEVRTAFHGVVRRLLTSDEQAILNRASSETTTATTSTPPAVTQPSPQRTTPSPVQTQTPTQTPARTPAQTPAQTPVTTKPPRVVEERVVPVEPPRTSTTTQPQPQPQTPATTRPTTTQPQRPAQQQTPAPAPRPIDAGTRVAEAERLLDLNRLNEARAIYREVLNAGTLGRETLLRVAEGTYRARDFASTVRAVDRAGTLRGGEEPYRYYLAVALYETGAYARAKRELAAALPFIEITPTVARYRARIEAAVP